MLLKNQGKNNGNMASQFSQFKKEIESSGKSPQQILNDLISSGKVSKSQLENAKNQARLFSYLIK